MITAKEAFKLGFVCKLAQHGLTMRDLQDRLHQLVEKQAFSLAPLLVGASGAIGVSHIIPRSIGHAVGNVAGDLTQDELQTLDEARKQYMLKRYKDLLRQRQAELNNRLISQAKKEVQ